VTFFGRVVESVDTPDLKSVERMLVGVQVPLLLFLTKYTSSGETMKYTLSQAYCFYMGEVVRMYFIQGLPYTFDELPIIIQEHPSVQTEALSHKDYDDEELFKTSNYLVMEEMHPLMYDIKVENPELLPKDD